MLLRMQMIIQMPKVIFHEKVRANAQQMSQISRAVPKKEITQAARTARTATRKANIFETSFLSGNALNGVPDLKALGRRRPKGTSLALGVRTGAVNILTHTHEHMARRSLKVEIHHNKNSLSFMRVLPS